MDFQLKNKSGLYSILPLLLAALLSSTFARQSLPGGISPVSLLLWVDRAGLTCHVLSLVVDGDVIGGRLNLECNPVLIAEMEMGTDSLVSMQAHCGALMHATAAGGSTIELETAFVTAQSHIAAASSHERSASAGLRDNVLSLIAPGLDPQIRAIVEKMITNRERKVPAELRCLQLDERGWRRLELACAKRAAGTTLSQEEAALLDAAASHQDVQFVAARIQAHAAGIEAVLNQRLAEAIAAQQAPAP